VVRDWDADLYEQSHSFVWKHGAALLDLLAPQPGECILDLGCGTGHLTSQIAAAGAAVVGIDSSPAMIDQARREFPALRFEVGDARAFAFAEPFDAVFSNAALHWVKPPEPVIACVRRALKPGGRFVAEFGGKGNVRAIAAALAEAARVVRIAEPDEPWYFPSIGDYASLLESDGLEVGQAALFDRPTALEGEQGMQRWVEMFGSAWLNAVPAARRDEFLRAVEERLRPALYRNGTWHADYRRLRVVARRVDP
jgi:trans-aconitate methyltransferase